MACTNCGSANINGNNCNCSSPIAMPIGPMGPQGVSGTNGSDGDDGQNAFTHITTKFYVPAIGNSETISVSTTGQYTGSWAVAGQVIFIENAGYYEVVSSTDTTITVVNLGYPGNATIGTTISSGYVSPAGLIGPTGATGSTGSAGSNADEWIYLGEFASHPANPNNLEFYKNSNGIMYFYDGSTSSWKVLSKDGTLGGTSTITLTSAGLTQTLTGIDARNIYLQGTATLGASVTISAIAGVWEDGATIRINYNGIITTAGYTVTLLGKLLTSEQALRGAIVITSTYHIGYGWVTTLSETYKEGDVQILKTTLSSASVLTLYSVPVVLINPPGAGKFLSIEGADALITYNTTAYDAASSKLYLGYTSGGGYVLSWTNAFIESGDDRFVRGLFQNNHDVFVNDSLQAYIDAADPTLGDSTITFYIKYRIITL